MATNIKISQLPAKGANLEATDLLEVSEFNGTGYVTKSITGQEIIDAVSSGGVTDVTATAPVLSTGGTTPDISMSPADTGHDGYLTSTDWNTFDGKQDALVSGTNIKTVEGQSLIGSGNINITATDVGLGNVDNTSDVNKPVSTATQTALNAKQDTLVSATNIKTINGSSVLGSGDLVVGGGGGGIHALVKPRTGRRVVQSIVAGATTGANFTVNRLVLIPFIPANTFTISEILMNGNTATAGSLCRLLIYSDNNGTPNSKLYESADLNLSTTGFKIATTTFTFNSGTTYWLAFHGGAIASNIIQNQPASLYAIANNAVTFTDTQTIFFITAVLGSAPATITSPNAAFGNAPWIALTPA